MQKDNPKTKRAGVCSGFCKNRQIISPNGNIVAQFLLIITILIEIIIENYKENIYYEKHGLHSIRWTHFRY